MNSPQIRNISKADKNRFFRNYLTTYSASIANQDGINVAVINSPPNLIDNLVTQIINGIIPAFTKFIETELNDDPKLYDRGIIYESEIKNSNIIIRWS